MTLARVCSVSEVPPGSARRVEVAGRPIAIVNLGDGGFRAIDAVCSHGQAFLDEGEVDTASAGLECPRHGSTFDLATGRPRSLPATSPVQVFPVTVRDDDVMIEVSDG